MRACVTIVQVKQRTTGDFRMSVDEIFREAHLLSPEDRIRLADSLMESIDLPDPDVEAAWMKEIQQRVDDLDSGRVKAVPGDEFMAELKRRYPGA